MNNMGRKDDKTKVNWLVAAWTIGMIVSLIWSSYLSFGIITYDKQPLMAAANGFVVGTFDTAFILSFLWLIFKKVNNKDAYMTVYNDDVFYSAWAGIVFFSVLVSIIFLAVYSAKVVILYALVIFSWTGFTIIALMGDTV